MIRRQEELASDNPTAITLHAGYACPKVGVIGSVQLLT